jgi:diguanylate cyclase (GGDEF)-like protein
VNDVVELGLRKPDAPSAAASTPPPGMTPLKSAAEAFLRVLSDFRPDASDKDIKQFTADVDDFRAQIVASSHEQELSRLVSSSIRACELFLRRSRHYHAGREAELAQLISILRVAASLIAGDSKEFNSRIRATTERFMGIAQLEDIRELRKTLIDEARALQKTIEAKQERDEKALSALTEKVEALQAHIAEAEEQAALDPLTKVSNRGTFDRSLATMAAAARNSKSPLSLVLVDIDHFKAINDTHGHPIGDRVLLCAAQWLTGAVRDADVVARYVGEEFGVIMPDADLGTAEARFRTVIEEIAARSFEYDAEGEHKSVRFTVSCGVAQLTGADTEQDLVHRADQALYDAKHAGRNRVVARKRSMLGSFFG